MRVVSLNVGMPRAVEWQGEEVITGIFKEPVTGPLALRGINFEGDAQADLTVHGGRDKAVYAYPFEHYPAWQERLGRRLDFGAFGENLTTEGLLETEVHIGDHFRVGTAVLAVTQPRMPCYKLGIRFGDPAMVKTFLRSGWPGIYFAIITEGIVTPGDAIERVEIDANKVSVAEMLRLMFDPNANDRDLERVLRIPTLAAVWRDEFEARLDH